MSKVWTYQMLYESSGMVGQNILSRVYGQKGFGW